MSEAGATQRARRRFFGPGLALPPFVDPAWRGCVLDRDAYDHTRMPQVLFDAVGHVRDECLALMADWSTYRDFAFDPDHYAIERVLFDDSGRWAIHSDFETTMFGAQPDLASRVDAILAGEGTSLAALTRAHFPHVDHADFAAYLRAVVEGVD